MKYTELASKKSLNTTVAALTEKGYQVIVASNGKQALEKIKALIPQDASVMNGASVTLEQIGFVDHLKSDQHGWNNVHAAIVQEKDPTKQAKLRKEALLSDYYLGSVHALTETGDMLIASNTGSQLPHVVYSSPNLVFVLSTKKIVSNLDEAMQRLEQHIIPLENDHMMQLYNIGTAINKIVIFKGESPMTQRKITVVLIEEDLGF